MTNYPEYKQKKLISKEAINATKFKRMYAEYVKNHPKDEKRIDYILSEIYSLDKKITYLSYAQLYYCIDNEIELVSILNLGKNNQMRIHNYSLVQPDYERKAILYTYKEVKIIKELYPKFTIVNYYDIQKYLQKIENSSKYKNEKTKLRLKYVINRNESLVGKKRSNLLQSQDDIFI